MGRSFNLVGGGSGSGNPGSVVADAAYSVMNEENRLGASGNHRLPTLLDNATNVVFADGVIMIVTGKGEIIEGRSDGSYVSLLAGIVSDIVPVIQEIPGGALISSSNSAAYGCVRYNSQTHTASRVIATSVNTLSIMYPTTTGCLITRATNSAPVWFFDYSTGLATQKSSSISISPSGVQSVVGGCLLGGLNTVNYFDDTTKTLTAVFTDARSEYFHLMIPVVGGCFVCGGDGTAAGTAHRGLVFFNETSKTASVVDGTTNANSAMWRILAENNGTYIIGGAALYRYVSSTKVMTAFGASSSIVWRFSKSMSGSGCLLGADNAANGVAFFDYANSAVTILSGGSIGSSGYGLFGLIGGGCLIAASGGTTTSLPVYFFNSATKTLDVANPRYAAASTRWGIAEEVENGVMLGLVGSSGTGQTPPYSQTTVFFPSDATSTVILYRDPEIGVVPVSGGALLAYSPGDLQFFNTATKTSSAITVPNVGGTPWRTFKKFGNKYLWLTGYSGASPSGGYMLIYDHNTKSITQSVPAEYGTYNIRANNEYFDLENGCGLVSVSGNIVFVDTERNIITRVAQPQVPAYAATIYARKFGDDYLVCMRPYVNTVPSSSWWTSFSFVPVDVSDAVMAYSTFWFDSKSRTFTNYSMALQSAIFETPFSDSVNASGAYPAHRI